MLRSVNSFLGTSVVARDGEIGHVRDLLFHDRSWIVRYLVVDTGNWLSGRRVLISPAVANFSGPASHSLRVNLTKEQVQKSPGIDSDLPVSRQHEIMMATYYGWPAYWAPETLNFPNVVTEPTKVEGDPDLRSATAVKNYAVTTTDGELGHLSDLITEDANWFIRFLVVGTGIWFAGQNLLVATRWVGSISILMVRSSDYSPSCLRRAVSSRLKKIIRYFLFEPDGDRLWSYLRSDHCLAVKGERRSPDGRAEPMSTENAVVAEYDTHSETEKAVQQVQKIGFGTEESFVGYYKLATASSHGVSTALFKPAQPSHRISRSRNGRGSRCNTHARTHYGQC